MKKEKPMSFKEIKHENYKAVIETPTVYVDNEARRRSGHMSHAMAEFAKGSFIDFNSNCSSVLWDGHMPYGWVEYRISRDCGKTYSDIQTLAYSMDEFLDGVTMISVEKAVACDDGTIVALCLRNDGTHKYRCEPWDTPTFITSTDEGKTWSAPQVYSPYRGRTYDAFYHEGVIYVLHLCNEHFTGTLPEHVYRLYKSYDNGKTFEEASVLPIDPIGRGYGSILMDDKGILHAYAYNVNDEEHMDHAVSEDLGKTWTLMPPCYLAKGIRNPQTAQIDGIYILHGRAGGLKGFVLYTSENGYEWDEGCMLVEKKGVSAYYSNNLNLTDEKGNFLLIQYSDSYAGNRVNVMHANLRIEKAGNAQ